MRYHVSVSAETFGADITVIVFDARMGHHVPGQVTGCDEGLIARVANVVPLVGMDLLVSLKISQRRKLLAADFALVGTFPCKQNDELGLDELVFNKLHSL